jgi:hypothetical protein
MGDIKLKEIIFRFYGIIVIVVFICAAVFLYASHKGKDEITIFLTIVGGLLSVSYFIQKQKLEELGLFRTLFTDFNERYDDLNDKLNKITEPATNESLEPEDIKTLNRYFNLCSEEYLFYLKGYIYLEVWNAWHNGMRYYLEKDSRIRDYWEKEEKTDSYYGLKILAKDKNDDTQSDCLRGIANGLWRKGPNRT